MQDFTTPANDGITLDMFAERSGRTITRRSGMERGAALAHLSKIVKRHPNEPFRQARLLIRLVGLQALTGRGRAASNETRIAYERRIGASLKALADMNIRLRNISELSPKHVIRLVAHWEEKNLSASSLQNRFTVLSRMLLWLDKKRDLPPLSRLLKDPAAGKRTLIRLDGGKSFSAKGRDVQEFIQRAYERNETFGHQCDLMNEFGLRPEEVVMFRPVEADKGDEIEVTLGTKGSKPRKVAITTSKQREVLDRAKAFVVLNPCKEGTFQEYSKMSIEQAQRRLRYHAEALKLTTKDCGLTLYSLRHEYAVRTYEMLAGEKPAVLGGKVSRKKDKEVRAILTQWMGHHRISVTGAYCSSRVSVDRAARKRLEKLLMLFKAPTTANALRSAGVTSLVLTGPAARGELIKDQVVVGIDGTPGCDDRALGILQQVLETAVFFTNVDRARAAGDTFEVF